MGAGTMTEFVDFSIHKREDEIQRILQDSSPVVVWPCEDGVLVVAANKDKRENRIHSIFDRIACVTLGGFSAGTILWQDAAYRASAEGHQLSKGVVSCRILLKTTSALLADSFQNLRRGPVFGAEAVFVEVASNRNNDYLAHVNFSGFVHTFNTAKLFGNISSNLRNTKEDRSREVNLAHDRLNLLWNPELSVQDSLLSLKSESILQPIFNSVRVEAIVLDRHAVQNGKFDKVLKRLEV